MISGFLYKRKRSLGNTLEIVKQVRISSSVYGLPAGRPGWQYFTCEVTYSWGPTTIRLVVVVSGP